MPATGILITVVFSLLLAACNSVDVSWSQPLPESTIFMAQGIENPRINLVWLEIPKSIQPGTQYVRIFLAKTDPPEPTIPNPNDLRCELDSEADFAWLEPERIPFEFKEDGTFWGSYTYKACPDCVECYMNWDYTLEITGSIAAEKVSLNIRVVHIGHNIQGSFLSTELLKAKNQNKEPHIKCYKMIECEEIDFVTRK